MNESEKITGKVFTIIMFIGILCGAVATALLPIFSYKSQKYSDFICELAALGTKKSGELLIYKLMLLVAVVLSVIVCLVYIKHSLKKDKEKKDISVDCERNSSEGLWWLLGAIILHAGLFLLSHTYSAKLIYVSLIGIWMFFTRKEKWKQYVILLICCYYAFTGAFLTYIYCFQFTGLKLYFGRNISEIEIILASFVLFMGCVFWLENKGMGSIEKAILFLQLFIPLNMFVYLRSQYLYGEERMVISYAWGYILVILVMMGYLIFAAYKSWKKNLDENANEIIIENTNEIIIENQKENQKEKQKENQKESIKKNINDRTNEKIGIGFDRLVSKSSVIMILILNSFIVPSKIVPVDTWHHGEQITEWQQVVEMGQKLYVDFFPSSGNFSMPIGFVLRFLCGNTGSDYQAAYSLIGLFCAFLVGFLLTRHLSAEKALLLVLLTGLPIYDRGYLLLPSLLILLLPDLIKDRSKWLKVWVICCMLAGLYYPTFGGALLIATMPFGLVQVYDFFQTGEFFEKAGIKQNDKQNKRGKTVSFILGWVLLIALVGASLPLFYRMAEYILRLAKYSLETDSLTLLQNGDAPEGFLIWLPNGYRYALYIFARIFIPMINVLLPATLCIVLFIKKRGFLRTPLFFVLSVAPLLQVVAYSFTLLRADEGILCSRTYAVILPMALLLIVGLEKEQNVKAFLSQTLKRKIYVTCIFFASVGIVSISPQSFPNTENGTNIGGLIDESMRFVSNYKVSEVAFIRLTKEQKTRFPKVGEGFIQRSVVKNMETRTDFIEKYHLAEKKFVNYTRFLYYINDIMACYSDSTFAIKSTEGQQAILKQFEKEKPIVVEIRPELNYEILKWMEANEYYTMNNGWYVAKTDVEAYHMENEVQTEYVMANYDQLERVPSSWGNSYETLLDSCDANGKLIEIDTIQRVTDEKEVENVERTEQSGQWKQEMCFVFPVKNERAERADYLYLELEKTASDENVRENEDVNQGANQSEKLDSMNINLNQKIWNYFWGEGNFDTQEVSLLFLDENQTVLGQMTMCIGDGKLLVPVGYSDVWRHENEVSQIKICAEKVSGIKNAILIAQ